MDLEREDTELVVVQLKRCHEKSVLLHCFYHPNTSPDPILKLNSSLCDNCESACIIVLGDFNLPELDWSGDQTAPMNNGSRADHNIFCDLMGENFLQQFIPGPTHLAGNCSATGLKSLEVFDLSIQGLVCFPLTIMLLNLRLY